MRQIEHSALVAQPPSRLFALINDIESYPQFIPWCTHARVESRTERQIIATLGVHRGPLRGQFTTRNELEPDRRIFMHLVSGPFRMLEGEWVLSPVAANGCRVQLKMQFAFRNPLTAMLFEQIFAQGTSALVDAFVARARELPA